MTVNMNRITDELKFHVNKNSPYSFPQLIIVIQDLKVNFKITFFLSYADEQA